ncbi:hypothetical protein AN216_12365 [Streptomyces oceani]|uniref:Putative restriction endonuclease domain-containing protein n=2 Tax=Streptomyces oceani TaxID=1075402 RepID=A0A1E7KHB1_9ACTN|nr:hypothetical protein AN216_12365 [Streptomyces oceani]
MTAERQERATPDTWMCPPEDGWTYDQVKDLELPFDWELVDGIIVTRGMTKFWHDQVRDNLCAALRQAKRDPCGINVERCVMVDEHNIIKPDIVVYDKTGLDVFTLECLPVEHVALVAEVVSPGSRSEDRFRKPGMLGERGVPYYWCVERGADGVPEVHEFWRHHEMGVLAPPDHPRHRTRLKTEVPFPVEVDLASLVQL